MADIKPYTIAVAEAKIQRSKRKLSKKSKVSSLSITQGGDWGFLISRALAHLYPASVKATHLNWIFAAQPRPSTSKTPAPEAIYSPRELAALGRMQGWWTGDGRGYLAIQSTKPSTIGFSLADSPVGLLAWIYGKLVSWSDAYPWTDDEVLTWASLSWFSTAGPEARSYHSYEALHGKEFTTTTAQAFIDAPPARLGGFPGRDCECAEGVVE